MFYLFKIWLVRKKRNKKLILFHVSISTWKSRWVSIWHAENKKGRKNKRTKSVESTKEQKRSLYNSVVPARPPLVPGHFQAMFTLSNLLTGASYTLTFSNFLLKNVH